MKEKEKEKDKLIAMLQEVLLWGGGNRSTT